MPPPAFRVTYIEYEALRIRNPELCLPLWWSIHPDAQFRFERMTVKDFEQARRTAIAAALFAGRTVADEWHHGWGHTGNVVTIDP